MNPNPTVIIYKCSSYDADLDSTISKLMSELIGQDSILSPGMNVLIKPNLLTDRAPSKAVTTHPAIVRSIIHFLKARDVEISVADSPSSAVKSNTVYQQTGFAAMCDEENVPLLNLEKEGSVERSSNGYSFHIAKPVLNADLIVNVPKIKTHSLTTLTAAVKNFYGTVPGYQKTHLHKMYPRPVDFGGLVRAIYESMPPNLSVADAIVGMEGNGPSNGTPVELGFIAASRDAVALDLAICRILHIAPSTVPYLAQSVDLYKNIEITGADMEDVTPASFKKANILPGRLIPRWASRILDPLVWVRPRIKDNCIACSRCVVSCPVEALSIDEKEKRAVLDKNKCIGCCCCHEICPENAIEMHQSLLLNILKKEV